MAQFKQTSFNYIQILQNLPYGTIQSADDFQTALFICQRHDTSNLPIWRVDISNDWKALKGSQSRSTSGIGIKTKTLMQLVGLLIGRVYVFNYIDKKGKFQGGRLCLPKDVPSNFDPLNGMVQNNKA